MSETKQVYKKLDDALDSFHIKVNRQKERGVDFLNFLSEHIYVRKKTLYQKYSFAGYEPLRHIAERMHEHEENWFLKGTQIGFSTLFIGWSFYCPMYRGLDTAYGLPDKINIKPFMKTRFTNQQLRRSPSLRRAFVPHESDMYYENDDSLLYFVGVNVVTEQLSRPVDVLNLDEVTVINTDAIDFIRERLGASEFPQLNAFARELEPGGPTDVGFQNGRQHIYMYKCKSCGHEQNLEECFYESSMNQEEQPKCVSMHRKNWRIVCESCGSKINRRTDGQWVARYPDRDVNSYRIPRLIFPGLNLNRMMRDWQTTASKRSRRAKLHGSMLAIPDAGDKQRITKQTLRELRRDYDMRAVSQWSVGGMDMGDICYIVFLEFNETDGLRTVWWQTLDSDHVCEQAGHLIEKMNCRCFITDGMPLTTEVRKLAYRFPDIVKLAYYRGEEAKEDVRDHLGNEYQIVTQDREASLDYYCDLFGEPEQAKIVFPAKVTEDGKYIDFEESEFAGQHIVGSQREEVKDARLGKVVTKYKKHCKNHYFHAGNYAAWAASILLYDVQGFSGVPPVFGDLIRA